MITFGCSLSTLVEDAKQLKGVLKVDLHPGDTVFVKTCNSVYVVRSLRDGTFAVSGGWFDRKGLSPMKVSITGCTWGGSAIKLDIIAACGLRLEFGNRVVTSPIRKVFLLPYSREN